MKYVFGSMFLVAALILSYQVNAQPNTYILNGSAIQNSCNCYTLTPAANTQSGSVWNANKINLSVPFDFVFNVFLGCTDANGADGMVFMLQPISTNVGTTGEGMGFQGISPSIGISLDTWQNTNLNDPVYDHISIQANGVVAHGSDMAGPIQASPTNADIEDCQWHTLRVAWDPVTQRLSTYFDGTLRLDATRDLIGTVFNNDPMVYWGFSAGTGGSNNLQQFCTALNPNFNTAVTANASCLGNPITFSNTSQSFAPIASYFWDFGDGNTSTLSSPPQHTYAAPGNYLVKLALQGLDGCNSDTLRRTIVVGDFPIANFTIADTCAGIAPRINELSQVTYGTLNQWNWLLDGSPISNAQFPQLSGLSSGPHTLALTATSNYGCASTLVSRNFNMSAKPSVSGSAANGCVDDMISFAGQQLDNATTIVSWNWQFGDNNSADVQNPQHMYSSPGIYQAVVGATSSIGCVSDPFTVPVAINQIIARAGNDTIVIKDVPFQLRSGYTIFGDPNTTLSYLWTPSIGLNDPTLLSPLTTLQDDREYQLTISTPEGCRAKDTVKITVFKGSAIYVPSGFTPNNDGLNERLKPYYIGITSLDYFQVFNRWGQLVFTTKDLGAGWNGVHKGLQQPSGTYVWILQATDFVGKVYKMKGTSTIVR